MDKEQIDAMVESTNKRRDTRYMEFAAALWREMLGEQGYIHVSDINIWREKDNAVMLYDGTHRHYIDLIAQRVYDLVTPEEYIDKTTRIRMTVEHDIPGHPRVTVHPPEENTLSLEQTNEAIRRLQQSAGLPQMDDPYQS